MLCRLVLLLVSTVGKQRRDGERKPLLQKEDDVNPPSLFLNGDHSTKLTNGTTNYDTTNNNASTNTDIEYLSRQNIATSTKTKTIPPSSPQSQ